MVRTHVTSTRYDQLYFSSIALSQVNATQTNVVLAVNLGGVWRETALGGGATQRRPRKLPASPPAGSGNGTNVHAMCRLADCLSPRRWGRTEARNESLRCGDFLPVDRGASMPPRGVSFATGFDVS